MGTAGPLELGPDGPRVFPLSPLDLVGLGLLQLALVLAFVDPLWSLLPLGSLIVLAGLAPFFPRWRLFLPVLSRGRSDKGVLLSFDDGPDPVSTPALLDLLRQRGCKALFFVVGEKAEAHPELIQAILADGHSLGNHSWDHDPWLMFRSRSGIAASLDRCQEVLLRQGVRPRLFRPPAWVVGPRLWPVLLRRGMACAVASCRALDWGNRRVTGMAGRMLRKLEAGQILALHDRRPASGELGPWLSEVEALLAGLERADLRACSPEEFFGASLSEGDGGAVSLFYDGMARDYDREIGRAGQSSLRRREEDWVLATAEQLDLPRDARVLDMGAGTGRFSVPLAAKGLGVTALDRSGAMLAVLAEKAGSSVEVRRGGLDALGPEETGFDLILACSVLEYVDDLGTSLDALAARLAPGGHLILTTAHPSCWRFFVQLGNAMRQGLWLRARGRRALGRGLTSAGLELLRFEGAGWRDFLGRPMLSLALARRGDGQPPHES